MSDKPIGKITLDALGAARISEQLWAYIVEEGGESYLKLAWPGWYKYGAMRNSCPLCEYTYQGTNSGETMISHTSCMERCPYAIRYSYTCMLFPSPFKSWNAADDPAIQLQHAKAFLFQLTMLRQHLEVQEFQSKPMEAGEKSEDGWEKVMYPRIPAGAGFDYRARVENGQVIVEVKKSTRSKPKDITSECVPILVKSGHSDGYYVALQHKGKNIIALGVDDKSASLALSGRRKYRMVKANGAVVSFNILEQL